MTKTVTITDMEAPEIYQAKPVKAMLFTGKNDRECIKFCPGAKDPEELCPSLMVPVGNSGRYDFCPIGHYIVETLDGFFEVMSGDTLNLRYEKTVK